MKQLLNIINRKLPPVPWEEGDCIPWSDPAFSERMLKEHLRQDHDAASRRAEKIDQHVAWIHGHLLGGRPTKVLDLTCGPGLYTTRLARLGHECVGIDYAPAAIRYAEELTREQGLACTHRLEDVREAAYGDGFGLVMMINGQFNVFSRPAARAILAKAYAALSAGGMLLLEPQTFAHVEAEGRQGPKWHSAESELFSDRPHLWLQENFWHADLQANTERYFIIDAATGEVTWNAQSNEAYTDEQFHEALAEAGFESVRLLPSLIGVVDESQSYSQVVVGEKA